MLETCSFLMELFVLVPVTSTDERLCIVSMDDSENQPDEKSERCYTKRSETVP